MLHPTRLFSPPSLDLLVLLDLDRASTDTDTETAMELTALAMDLTTAPPELVSPSLLEDTVTESPLYVLTNQLTDNLKKIFSCFGVLMLTLLESLPFAFLHRMVAFAEETLLSPVTTLDAATDTTDVVATVADTADTTTAMDAGLPTKTA